MTAFMSHGTEPKVQFDSRYDDRWTWWDGTWRRDPSILALRHGDPRMYDNTRQLWRTSDAIVSLYEQFVYAGDLSTDGGPLPDGTDGAIPIDAQTGKETSDILLKRAFAELWSVWRWRQHMTLRPKYAAILGDCLTELIDDRERGFVFPRTIWPGYVVDLKLNDVGDVVRYALEWPVTVPESRAYGVVTKAETYLFRKEVDGKAFRYYKNGQPASGPWGAPEQPNPYEFCPAIWDRHEIVFGVRGLGALDRTIRAAKEINSTLSHALDYQSKKFAAPVGVVGSALSRRQQSLTMPRNTTTGDFDEDQAQQAQTLGLLPMNEKGQFVTIDFDIGQTVNMINILIESVIAESPEARYGQELLKLTGQATGPAVELILAPIVGKVQRARANHDPQTVKLMQMALSIIAFRLKTSYYDSDLLVKRKKRYDVFAKFDEESFDRGLMDCTIKTRDVFPETAMDRINRVIQLQAITDPFFMQQAGVAEDEIEEIMKRRDERQSALREQGQLSFNRGDTPPDDEE